MKLKKSHKIISLILINLFCVTLSLFFIFSKNHAAALSQMHPDLLGEKIPYTHEIKNSSGPWGNLEIVPVIIQAKSEYFTKDTNYNAIVDTMKSSGHWTFQNLRLEEVRSLFS